MEMDQVSQKYIRSIKPFQVKQLNTGIGSLGRMANLRFLKSGKYFQPEIHGPLTVLAFTYLNTMIYTCDISQISFLQERASEPLTS